MSKNSISVQDVGVLTTRTRTAQTKGMVSLTSLGVGEGGCQGIHLKRPQFHPSSYIKEVIICIMFNMIMYIVTVHVYTVHNVLCVSKKK
jgi:hypothetical protein